MKKVIALTGIIICLIVLAIFFYLNKTNGNNFLSPLGHITEKPLAKYSFDRLKIRKPSGGDVSIGEKLKEDPNFISYIFYYTTEGKRVSGMLNLPPQPGKYPVLILLRGFIDPLNYTTGDGTRRDGEIFAQNGFIALAPDFLGYGKSASPSADPIEERFQTYTTALDLLSSVNTINNALADLKSGISADTGKIGIWAHSNGGQIALSALTITGKSYPTVLWAPVTKPFPYSILYYTDESPDYGKALRKVVANFEKDYDSDKYTFTNYLDWINAPIQLNQGTADEEVPQKWSDQFVKELQDKGKDITYFTYPGEDHNFDQGSWSTVIEKNIAFYQKEFAQ